jgi:acyl-CoA synthetase (AMP-forming)/AMP-acid ligase II
LAIELDPRQLPADQEGRERTFGEIVDAVRAAVATEHGVNLSLVAIVGVGSVPKTSSGKLRRRACRDALMDGSLGEVARWTAVGFASREYESRLLRTSA